MNDKQTMSPVSTLSNQSKMFKKLIQAQITLFYEQRFFNSASTLMNFFMNRASNVAQLFFEKLLARNIEHFLKNAFRKNYEFLSLK